MTNHGKGVVKNLPKGWRASQLGEVLERVSDLRGSLQPEPTVLSCSKDYGLIPQKDLFKKRLAANDTSRYRIVNPGDFVYDPNLLWSGSVARSRLDEIGIVSPVYEVFRTNRECHADYLHSWVGSPNRLTGFRSISMGTNVRRRRADFEDLCKLPILLPPLAEQHAIAAVLDSIDGAIERTDDVIAATERLRDALLHELLTRGVPGWHSAWKDVPGLGTVPASWEVVRLGDVCEPPQYGAAAPAIPFDSSLPRYVRITDITDDGRLRPDDARSAEPSQALGYELQAGDLLFARSGATVGKTYLYESSDGPCVYAGYLIRFQARLGLAKATYLWWFTQSGYYQAWVASMFRAGAQPNINAQEYASMSVPLPSIGEQEAIVGTLVAVDEAVERARGVRAGLQALKASASDALLTGRVRVNMQGG